MRRHRRAIVLLGFASGGCGVALHHSALRTTDAPYSPHPGPVCVYFAHEPAGVQVAIVQVYSPHAGVIERLVPEMTRVAAGLGADCVKIDRVKTLYETHDESQTTSYECGTEKEPKTCTDTHTETVHDATTQLLGRAFRTAP